MAEDVQGAIDNLKIVVTGGARGVESSLDAIANALKKLKEAVSGNTASNLNKTSTAIGNLGGQLSKVSFQSIKKMEKLADVLERLSKYNGLKFKVDGSFGSTASKATRGGALSTIRNPNWTRNSSTETSRGPDMAGGADTVAGSLGGDVSTIPPIDFGKQLDLAKAEATIKKFTDKIKKFFKNLKRSILRVTLYRAIRSAIQGITSSISQGMQNAYNYSKSVNGEWAKAKDNISASTTYLKNALGAAAAELVTTLEPAITSICDGLANAANKIAEMNAYLRGSSTYTKAVKKDVDELTRSLMGFDEINKLGNTDSSDAFTTETVSTGAALGTLAIVGLIGTAIASWTLGSFIKELGEVIEAFKTIGGLKAFTTLSSWTSAGAAASGAAASGAAASGAAASGAAASGAAGSALAGGAAISGLGALGLGAALAAAVIGATVYVKDRFDKYGILLSDYGDKFGEFNGELASDFELITEAQTKYNEALASGNETLIKQAEKLLDITYEVADNSFGTDGEFALDYFAKNSNPLANPYTDTIDFSKALEGVAQTTTGGNSDTKYSGAIHGILSNIGAENTTNVYIGDTALDNYYSAKYGKNVRNVMVP